MLPEPDVFGVLPRICVSNAALIEQDFPSVGPQPCNLPSSNNFPPDGNRVHGGSYEEVHNKRHYKGVYKVWGPNVNSGNEATRRRCTQEVVLFVARQHDLQAAAKNSYQIISVLLSLLLGAEFSAVAKVKLRLVLLLCGLRQPDPELWLILGKHANYQQSGAVLHVQAFMMVGVFDSLPTSFTGKHRAAWWLCAVRPPAWSLQHLNVPQS